MAITWAGKRKRRRDLYCVCNSSMGSISIWMDNVMTTKDEEAINVGRLETMYHINKRSVRQYIRALMQNTSHCYYLRVLDFGRG
jgi:hypothetical protein